MYLILIHNTNFIIIILHVLSLFSLELSFPNLYVYFLIIEINSLNDNVLFRLIHPIHLWNKFYFDDDLNLIIVQSQMVVEYSINSIMHHFYF